MKEKREITHKRMSSIKNKNSPVMDTSSANKYPLSSAIFSAIISFIENNSNEKTAKAAATIVTVNTIVFFFVTNLKKMKYLINYFYDENLWIKLSYFS